MNIQEQIRALEATRAAKAAAMIAIMTKAGAESRSTNSDEGEEYDGLSEEIEQIDADLVRLKRAEALMVQTAQPVRTVQTAVKTALPGTPENPGRGPTILIDRPEHREEKFKGQNFTRMVIARAAAFIKNHEFTPAAYAEHRWGKSAAGVVSILRAGVPGGGTGSDQWGHELLDLDTQYRGDFIEYLYSRTVYDRLPLRQVPANVLIRGQDGAATGYWVGEKKAIPATNMDFFDVTLRPLKVAALAAISNELLLSSDPAAEQLVRDGLVNASSQRVDQTFLSTNAAVANVSPAGMLNGVSALSAGGEDAQSLRDDIGRLYASFITGKNASNLWYVMYTGLAKSISLMRNPLDQTSFPGVTANGGTFEGDQLITGENVAADDLILLRPEDIYRIGDTGFDVQLSKEATIEMDTVPTGDGHVPASASANMVSMFQNEMTAFKVVRHINFAKRRANAVAYIGNATYGGQQT